jgi:hypothetical protein
MFGAGDRHPILPVTHRSEHVRKFDPGCDVRDSAFIQTFRNDQKKHFLNKKTAGVHSKRTNQSLELFTINWSER